MAGETPGRVPVYTALAHPITPGTEPPGVKIPPSRVMATQAPSQHIENAESVQTADEEQWTRQRSGIDGASSHVTVKDIAADTQLEQWTSTSRCTPTRDRNCQIHTHTHATLRRQAQHIDGV